MPKFDIDEGALLSASSAAGAAASKALSPLDQKVALYIFWSQNALLPGNLLIETAHDPTFGGTWEQMALFSVGANSVDRYQAEGPFAAVRTRILTSLASGSVSTWLVTA